MNIRALVAEAVGTFILIFFGSLGVATFAITTQGQLTPIYGLLVLPFAFGLGLMAALAIAGPASGGHFNPAVTLAALLDSRLDWKNALGYVAAQVIGGVGASISILLITSVNIVAASANQPAPLAATAFESEIHAFAVEAILTTVFVAVILTVTRQSPNHAIIVIPLTLVAIHFAAVYVSGASVNPVRSLAPAVVSGTYTSLWVYLTGPFVGSFVGWGIYRLLTSPNDGDAEGSDDLDDEFDDDEDDDR